MCFEEQVKHLHKERGGPDCLNEILCTASSRIWLRYRIYVFVYSYCSQTHSHDPNDGHKDTPEGLKNALDDIKIIQIRFFWNARDLKYCKYISTSDILNSLKFIHSQITV